MSSFQETELREVLHETSITVQETKVHSVRQSEIERHGLRQVQGGLLRVAGALGSVSRDQLRDELSSSPALGYRVPPLDQVERRTETLSPALEIPAFLEQIEAFLQGLQREHPRQIFSHKISISDQTQSFTQEGGPKLWHRDRRYQVGLLFKAEGSPELLDGLVGFQTQSFEPPAWSQAIRDVLELESRPLTWEEVPAGDSMAVLFPSQVGLSHPLSWMQRELSGEAFATESSSLTRSIGAQIFHPELDLGIDRRPESGSFPFFDAEGVFHEKDFFPLIEAGVLRAPATDGAHALRASLPWTGSSRAAYDARPQLDPSPPLSVRSRPVGLGAGQGRGAFESNLRKALGGTPAILTQLFAGGEATAEGNYATPVQSAYFFDGERFLGKLPEIQVRGNLRVMLGEDFLGTIPGSLVPGAPQDWMASRMQVRLAS